MNRNPFRDPVLWVAALFLAATAALATESSLRWLGRSFPGFLVLDNGVVASAGLAHWPATSSRDIYQSQLIVANERAIRSGAELDAFVAELAEGTKVRYRLRRGDAEFEIDVPVQRFERSDYALLFGAICSTDSRWEASRSRSASCAGAIRSRMRRFRCS
jgi:hypothetical protein